MSAMLSSPRIATPAQPTKPPGLTDPLVQQGATLATQAAAAAKGFGSTILTGGQGLSNVPTTKKQLLGG